MSGNKIYHFLKFYLPTVLINEIFVYANCEHWTQNANCFCEEQNKIIACLTRSDKIFTVDFSENLSYNALMRIAKLNFCTFELIQKNQKMNTYQLSYLSIDLLYKML